MMKVFVSFDYENDRQYKFLLTALAANRSFDFSFEDVSSKEINSYNIDRIKAGLTTKIRQADVTVVIIGKEANKRHRDASLIGHRNWQNFEIAQSIDAGNKIIGVKLKSSYESPEELLGNCDKWAIYSVDSITRALHDI